MQRLPSRAHPPGGAQNYVEIALQGREQRDQPGVPGQRRHLLPEEPCAAGQRVRQRLPPGELSGAQPPHGLAQGQRVAPGQRHQLPPHPGRHPAPRAILRHTRPGHPRMRHPDARHAGPGGSM
ncbi:hypothetical protein [[Actinomadura] parvosata]|uniref:hypothetical protein n=1 Tax=[Actinomadura] parvosata TaxID=1955412 RepID=UPI001E2D67A5|nr:hypothetical protein [Nonomuraea sp. ATCC 55076]